MKAIHIYERQLTMPGGAQYLPYASGLLAAYLKKHVPGIRVKINAPRIGDIRIAAFSTSLWNLNWSIKKAGEIMRDDQSCRVIFGGPSASEAEKRINGIDVIHGEGEAAFLEAITGIKTEIKTLDDIPSPYITGIFDEMIHEGSQAIVETNRGCFFGCAYCFWSNGSKRMKFHSLDYIRAEAEWLGAHKIKYVFCANGNFGMFPMDVEIAKIYADVKRRYGYPEKFRVCYGKNSEESIFETAKILAEADLSKSVTLSPQSRNPVTLATIGRQNISDDFFDRMQARHEAAGIPVYTELILGLPGETYESFRAGLLKSMKSGNQLFVYHCEALPGTRLIEPDYMREHGILTRRVLLTPVHCAPIYPKEFEDIVVGTKTMPVEDWKRAAVLAWFVQLAYSMGAYPLGPEEIIEMAERKMTDGDDPIIEYFKAKAEAIVDNEGRCDLINGIYFEPEEAAFIKWFCRDEVDPVAKVIHARKSGIKRRTSS